MFSPTLMEKVAQGQQFDRLHEAETNRLFKENHSNGSLKLKLSVIVSGAALALLMIAQIV